MRKFSIFWTRKAIAKFLLLFLLIAMSSCGSWLEVMDSSLRSMQQVNRLVDKSKRTYDDCKTTFTPKK